MDFIFTWVYDFFKRNRSVFYGTFLTFVLLFALGAYRINIEEDVTRIFPNDDRVEKLNQIFQESRFMEKLVFTVSLTDSSTVDPDRLINVTRYLVNAMDSSAGDLIKAITAQVDDQQIVNVVNTVLDHLPVYLEEDDFVFAMHQGYQFYYFKRSLGKHSPIFYYMEGANEAEESYSNFAEFVEAFENY